jgi:hypothetical protein
MDQEKSHAVLDACHIHVTHRGSWIDNDAIVAPFWHEGLLAALRWNDRVRELELTAEFHGLDGHGVAITQSSQIDAQPTHAMRDIASVGDNCQQLHDPAATMVPDEAHVHAKLDTGIVLAARIMTAQHPRTTDYAQYHRNERLKPQSLCD